VLTDMENNVATGFVPNAAAFFNLVRAHTIQGTFCGPYYGGNANFVGWDLIGFPGNGCQRSRRSPKVEGRVQ
jgi:gluconate 2-dehydrogenase gamma chain